MVANQDGSSGMKSNKDARYVIALPFCMYLTNNYRTVATEGDIRLDSRVLDVLIIIDACLAFNHAEWNDNERTNLNRRVLARRRMNRRRIEKIRKHWSMSLIIGQQAYTP